MTRPLKTQFIVADGGRARWVRRNAGAEDLVTIRTLHAAHDLTGGSKRPVFEGSACGRFSLEERPTATEVCAARFPAEVAEAIDGDMASGEIARLAIVAPSRTLAQIVRRLTPAATARLAGTVAKDLGKTPDHELSGWLQTLEMG